MIRSAYSLVVCLILCSTAAAEEPAVAPPVAAAEAEPGEAGEGAASGWFRVDLDAAGTQLWFGATHPVGGVDIASNIYLSGGFGEIDIGPALTLGEVSITPQIGLGFDFPAARFAALIPQLYTIADGGALYFESWIQVPFFSPFEDGAGDLFYTRDFVLFELSERLAAGPQVELTYRLNEQPGMFTSGVISLPIGAAVRLGYGKGNTLLLFLGYDLQAAADSHGIAGRLTFLRTW